MLGIFLEVTMFKETRTNTKTSVPADVLMNGLPTEWMKGRIMMNRETIMTLKLLIL
jgi:hypothetical protein